ncbi:MAG: glutamate--cysteine ligase [Gammaproteobacteria bacterium]|nr:glutamate--cysteine ligase [Gammaproteobacteria bacterium]
MNNLESLVIELQRSGAAELLQRSLTGLEKESLRVAPDGTLSQKPHPALLGSALTHSCVTTDYSEAMLELITPPMRGAGQSLEFLCDIHTHVYKNLGDEILWATSMPCVLAGETHIPIARYGESHAGRMKHVYRVGLGHRYGKVMQVIAGVHYNYSIAESFWPLWADFKGVVAARQGEEQQLIDAGYMGMVRNLQRYGWIIPYLFGASPAVCKTFFGDQGANMQEFDEGTYYEPYATSLRMSDIGYQNQKEESVGIKANYNTLESYIDSLRCAINTSSPVWEQIGLKDEEGNYKQLNTNILQIENEYYSTVRPKQLLQGMEKPTSALNARGIRYVELRSLDVNAYQPQGIDETQMLFLEAFLLTCMFQESPAITLDERPEIDNNLLLSAHRGREPRLNLRRNGADITLRAWGEELLCSMEAVCSLLDANESDTPYQAALNLQRRKIESAVETPSALMLDEMRENGESFYHFARRKSLQHNRYFHQRNISRETEQHFIDEGVNSLQRQQQKEAADSGAFDVFLADYFASG